MAYNASDPKQIREAKKRERIQRQERQGVVLSIMLSTAGRHYMYDRLVSCHIFHSSFSLDPYTTAYHEGERNVGLQLLGDIMSAAPDQYIAMMREANDREIANGGRTDDNGYQRDQQDDGGGDSGSDPGAGSTESEYEPGSDEDSNSGA